MKNIVFLPLLSLAIIVGFSSCKKKSVAANELVSQFVYDGLSTYYYWAEEMKDKKPSENAEPKTYFKSVLNSIDREHQWSYITDNVNALLAGYAGTPIDFGFEFQFIKQGTTNYALIQYVYPNTPASSAGMKRRDIIGKIDGQNITVDNYAKLYGEKTISLTMYKIAGGEIVEDRTISVTPAKIYTDPVYHADIFEINGKKIGYLFYTAFTPNYNSSLYDVFQHFKNSGVTDLVLDLRYNRGGSTNAANYLTSLIVPENFVKNNAPFYMLKFNDFINSAFDEQKESRVDNLGSYDLLEGNPLLANINLKKVYIIATEGSYSASELTLFCARQYMDVVHIGGNTGGKYTASWTIHPFEKKINDYKINRIYDDTKLSTKQKETLKNWAMQPIVAIYSNAKGGDFINPGYLAPEYPLKEGWGYLDLWTEIGDPKDVFLGQALFLITGDESYKPVEPVKMARIKAETDMKNQFVMPLKHRTGESLIIDNPKFIPEKLIQVISYDFDE